MRHHHSPQDKLLISAWYIGAPALGLLFLGAAYLASLRPERYPTYSFSFAMTSGALLLALPTLTFVILRARAFVDEQKVKKVGGQNPFLSNALYSLVNAIEFTEKKDDRYRQAALVEMDAAVESLLKAKLFKDDPVDFMKSDWEHLTYEKAMEKVGCRAPIPESSLLREAHSERNKAQHRAVIASSSWTEYHLNNVYVFAERFCGEHFNLDLEQVCRTGLSKKTENRVVRIERAR